MDKKEGITPEFAEKYAYDAVNNILRSMEKDELDMESLKNLCDLAFHSDNNVSEAVLEPMFGTLINNLKKSFKRREGDFYLKIFSHFILESRKKSPVIDKWFSRMSISESNPLEDIYSRNLRIRENKEPWSIERREKIKKIVLLSRNTIGAEAYINGIILNRLLKNMKNAEIILPDTCNIGKHLFNHPRIRLVDKFVNEEGKEISLTWKRNGIGILERFEYTANLAEFIELEKNKLKEGELIVFDADTRLSQTGAMPICEEPIHYFIDTVLDNDNIPVQKIKNFGILCNEYLNGIFQENEMSYPEIFVLDEKKKKAKEFRNNLPKDRPVIMLHFGSGIKSKTLSQEIENELALTSFNFGTPLIVRTPVEWEEQMTDNLIRFLEQKGKKQGKDFFTFKGTISSFVSLVGEVDLCIGYDSQCQHMAAAQNIPFITLFTGNINKVFLKRWTPISKNFFKIIEVDKEKGRYDREENFRKECNKGALNETISALNEVFTL